MNEFEGPRFYRLVSALKLVVEKICQICSWERFIDCFPPEFVEENKELLYTAYTNSFNIFRENIYSEFKLICQEFKLLEKLNDLDTSYVQINETEENVLPKDWKKKSFENQQRIYQEMKQILASLKNDSKKTKLENEDLKKRLEEASIVIQNQAKQLEDCIRMINKWENENSILETFQNHQ